MKVVNSLTDLRAARAALSGPLGLVPTMGYLHEGHVSLARRAKTECASVAASIFVNPTQFGPSEDLAAYPRDLPRDLDLLEAAGVDLVWTPTPDIVYPAGFQTWVTVDEVTKVLEGAQRPMHFRGVTTVVAKLFNAFQPDRAYFGQKDAQQVVVIKQMARDLDFPVEIVVCPTKREPDGLAMSSRNAYLNLSRALRAAEVAFDGGQRDAGILRQIMADTIDAEPLARRQYVSCADPETLQEQDGSVERALLSMAVYVGKTRLIDNVLIGN